MHQRLQPFEHKFSYPVHYVHSPLQQLAQLPLGKSRFSLVGLLAQDHGDHQPAFLSLQTWAQELLCQHGCEQAGAQINLLAIPRSLGFGFNPVTFWFCLDKLAALRAVICQVNNTFGETHNYVCHKPDRSPINPEDELGLSKQLHVSPFFPRSGFYSFHFDYQPAGRIAVLINYHQRESGCQLRTSLSGELTPLTSKSRWEILRAQPFIGLSAYARIHKQAWRLWRRGARYHPKPVQLQPNNSNV